GRIQRLVRHGTSAALGVGRGRDRGAPVPQRGPSTALSGHLPSHQAGCGPRRALEGGGSDTLDRADPSSSLRPRSPGIYRTLASDGGDWTVAGGGASSEGQLPGGGKEDSRLTVSGQCLQRNGGIS